MRFSLAAAAACLCLGPLAVALSAPPAATQPPPAKAAPAPPVMSSEGSSADAAVRHAKRTACRKEARAKKLVGAEKNSYITGCVAGH
jgi:hypothetical protein